MCPGRLRLGLGADLKKPLCRALFIRSRPLSIFLRQLCTLPRQKGLFAGHTCSVAASEALWARLTIKKCPAESYEVLRRFCYMNPDPDKDRCSASEEV